MKAIYSTLSNSDGDLLTIQQLAALPKPQQFLSQLIRSNLVKEFEEQIHLATDSERRLAHWNSVKHNHSAKVFTATCFTRNKQIGREKFATMV